jgi:hypothetical protein
MMGLENFNLKVLMELQKNWNEYGKWFSENILKGTEILNDDSKSHKTLVGSLETIKKGKK